MLILGLITLSGSDTYKDFVYTVKTVKKIWFKGEASKKEKGKVRQRK